MATDVPDFSQAVRRFDEGHSDEATKICHGILAGQPRHAGALHMLGVVARQRGQMTESLELIDRSLREAPERAVAWFDRGTTLYQNEQIEPALEAYRRTAALDPKLQEAALNLGAILEKIEQYDEALPWALRAIELRPDCPRAQYNLGNIFRATGRLRSAITAYQEAVRLQPDYAQAHWNLAHCYLLLGDFGRGWPAYEWREKSGEVFFDRHTGPRWDGSSLAGKTLLVHAEQGIGDEIMFAACYDEVVARAAHCIFVCEPRLAELIKRSFPRSTVYSHARRSDWAPAPIRESYDWQIPAGSLPLYLRRSISRFSNSATISDCRSSGGRPLARSPGDVGRRAENRHFLACRRQTERTPPPKHDIGRLAIAAGTSGDPVDQSAIRRNQRRTAGGTARLGDRNPRLCGRGSAGRHGRFRRQSLRARFGFVGR